MKLAVIKEKDSNEHRVAITPEIIGDYIIANDFPLSAEISGVNFAYKDGAAFISAIIR